MPEAMKPASLADDAARRNAMCVHDRTFLVEAGAGSGKTAVLAGRMVMLLASGVAPKHIAAVTFTELAASELLLRVREYVDAGIAGRVPEALRIALPRGLSSAARAHLAAAVDSLDEITCSTIHGFCQQLIKPYPVAASLDPGASVMDRDEADLNFEETQTEWLKAALDGDQDTRLASLVWHDQAEALRLFRMMLQSLQQHPGLEVRQGIGFDAGWGAFKAAVDAFSEFLGASQVHEPETAEIVQILGATVAVDTVKDEADEIEQLLKVMTIRQEPVLFTKDGSPRVYRRKAKWAQAAARQGFSKAEGGRLFASAKALYDRCLDSLVALGSTACSRLLALTLEDLRPAVDAYARHKRATAQLDFDDLIRTARGLLCHHDDIRISLGKRYTHVLVDEFQDTDPLQTEIFWRLCGDPPAGESDGDWTGFRIRPGALFLVGDPKQAIYRFRGADVAAYVRARALLLAEDKEAVLSISTNFRSLSPILEFVNAGFKWPLSQEHGQPGFTPLEAFHDAQDEQCLVRLDIEVEPDDKGKVRADMQRQAEAEAVAALCARLIGSEVFAGDSAASRTCKPGDIALLAPSGTELWRYEEALEHLAIPVVTQAGKGLYRRQEIQDLIALTRVLADSRDTLALGALLRGPLVGLTEEMLLDMVERLRGEEEAEDESLPRIHLAMDLEAIDNTCARDIVEKLRFLYRTGNSTTPHHLLSQAIDLLRVRPILMRRHSGQAERVLANVDLYLSMSRAYGVRGLKAFAEAMTAAWSDEQRNTEGRPDAQEESVALFTMHAAKGLEWRVVVPINTMTELRSPERHLVDRENGHLYCPAFGATPWGYEEARAVEKQEIDRENVRLWYVAATRARDLLVLPNIIAERKQNMWNQVVDLGVAELPQINLDAFAEKAPRLAGDAPNEQTREVFSEEAARISESSRPITWLSPSRDEHIAAPLAPADNEEVFSDSDQALPDSEVAPDIQGGWDRGQVIHKLFEEVLTGETQALDADLTARAEVLIRQLGKTVSDAPRLGLAPSELAACVLRTLALPEIDRLRPRLVPECSVFGSRLLPDGEHAFAGVADAIAVADDGKPEAVIDWKTDVKPSPSQLDHYHEQVRAYLEITGASRGLIVLVTTGRMIEVG